MVDEVVGLGPRRLAFGVVLPPAVGELAYQLFFLGADRDHRLVPSSEGGDLAVKVAELSITVRVRRSFLLLGWRLERVAEALQDPPDGVVGDFEPLADEVVGQLGRRLGGPAQEQHRVPPCLGVDQLVYGFQKPGLLHLCGTVAVAVCSSTGRRLDPRENLDLDHGVTGHTRSRRHRGLPTPSETRGHCAGHHPALDLVQVW